MKNFVYCLVLCLVAGCSPCDSNCPVQKTSTAPFKISLAYSEYPSWSTFGVAESKGLIDGAEGKQGSIEKQNNVDIILKLVDYDTCIGLYGQGLVDSVCITNVDVLSPSQRRKTVVFAPTSTSVGADALIANSFKPNIDRPSKYTSIDSIDWDDLDNDGKITASDRRVYGLEKSVSELVFDFALTKMGKDPKDFTFTNLDPAAAATALQTNQKNVKAIMVWNPFVLQTLRTNANAKLVLSSETIPEAVIDCLAIGQDVVDKEGSERGIKAILDSFYTVSDLLAGPDRDKTLVALGEKFCSLDAKDMATCCEQTRFYDNREKATKLFESQEFKQTMTSVVAFAIKKELISPKIDNPGAVLNNGSTSVYQNPVEYDSSRQPSATVLFTTKYLKN